MLFINNYKQSKLDSYNNYKLANLVHTLNFNNYKQSKFSSYIIYKQSKLGSYNIYKQSKLGLYNIYRQSKTLFTLIIISSPKLDYSVYHL